MPRAGFSPGIATHCPHPSGAGEERREPGGVGATRRDLRVPPPAGRGRAPSPHKPDPGHDGTEQGSLPIANLT